MALARAVSARMKTSKIIEYAAAAPKLYVRICASISTAIGRFEYVYSKTEETNSPSAVIITSNAPEIIPGEMVGRRIFQNLLHNPAPNVCPASINEGSTCSSDADVERTTIGNMRTK